MAKRRRKKPNISEAVLQQARQGEAESTAAQEPRTDASPAPSGKAPTRRRRRTLQAAQLEQRKDAGTLDGDYVAELLANPTKVVTEEDLRADYGFVIKDLRNMGILAAVLFIALVLVSLVLL